MKRKTDAEYELIDLISAYRDLVRSVEGVWVWSTYDLEHDEWVRGLIEACLDRLSPEQREELSLLDTRFLESTVESEAWRREADNTFSGGFWFRLPKRLDGWEWEDYLNDRKA
ncbi:MAG: hypothetical protein ABL949_07130 [Fimbriimonadaceae bacterium]